MARLELTTEDSPETVRCAVAVLTHVPSPGHGGVLITLKEAIDVINEILAARRTT